MRKAIGVILGASILSVVATKCDDNCSAPEVQNECENQTPEQCLYKYEGGNKQNKARKQAVLEVVQAQNEIDIINKKHNSGDSCKFEGAVDAGDEIANVYTFQNTDQYCPKKKCVVKKPVCNTKPVVVATPTEDCEGEKKGFTFAGEDFDKGFEHIGKGWEKQGEEHREIKSCDLNEDNKNEGGYFHKMNTCQKEDKEDNDHEDHFRKQDKDHEEHEESHKKHEDNNDYFKDQEKDQTTQFNAQNKEIEDNHYKDERIEDKENHGDFVFDKNAKKDLKEIENHSADSTNNKDNSESNSNESQEKIKEKEAKFDLNAHQAHENEAKSISKNVAQEAEVQVRSNFRRDQNQRSNNVNDRTDRETQHHKDEEEKHIDRANCRNAKIANQDHEDCHFDLAKDNNSNHNVEFAEQKHQDAGIRQGLISCEDIELKEHVQATRHCKGECVEKKRWLKKSAHKKSFREKHGKNKHAKCIKNKAKNCDKFGVLKKNNNCKQNHRAADDNSHVKVCKRVEKQCDKTDDETTSVKQDNDRTDNADFQDTQNINQRAAATLNDVQAQNKQTKDARINTLDVDRKLQKNKKSNKNASKTEDCGCN